MAQECEDNYWYVCMCMCVYVCFSANLFMDIFVVRVMLSVRSLAERWLENVRMTIGMCVNLYACMPVRIYAMMMMMMINV